MAKGKKTGGRNFQPGQSGNPNGPTPIPEDIKQARKLNQIEFERIANKFLFMNRKEIADHVNKPETPALELLVGSIVSKAVSTGDQVRLNFLLDRLIGKVAEKHQHAGPNGEPLSPQVVILPSNGREAK